MVPSMYLAIPQIPMTTTGKTDRLRLREIGSSLTLDQLAAMQPSRATEKRAPQTEMEYRLQQLWAATLGIGPSSIGTEDSFLRIGGESMAAIRLVQLARKEGIVLTVADIFNQPRLCEMARAAQEKQTSVVPIVPPFSLLRGGAGEPDTRALAAAAACGVAAQSIADILPCTPLQEGLLALTAKQDGDYVHQLVSKLPATVDLVRLQAALTEVIQEAPILRTRIVDLPNAGLMQVVLTERFEWTTGSELDRFLESEKARPMGLGTPLSRFGLVSDHREGNLHFVWTIHHALYDGWSLPLLLERIEAVYAGDCSDSLPSFAGFVRYLADCPVADAHAYWQSQLNGAQAAVFPALPSPEYQPQCRDLLQCSIANVTWPGNDITASTAVRTAWAILTARYTLSADVLFGATVSGRQAPVPYIERMAGPTIATVPIRVNVQADSTVASLMQSIQSQAVAMIPYEQTGLKQIRQINSDTEQATQLQSLLVVQPPSSRSSRPPDECLLRVDLDAVDEFNTINTYALMLECRLGSNEMGLRIRYDRELIGTEQVERIAKQFEAVLRHVCSQETAQELVCTVTAASEDDLAQIWAWNATVPQNIPGCVHDLIAQRTQQQPDAPAICAWDGQLSYRELDVLSTRLAFSLVQRGAGRNTVIPLCFEKTVWTPVAMLAAIKAGSTVVAMDPGQPEDRLESIVKQTQPPLILASETYMPLASRLTEVAICVNTTALQVLAETCLEPPKLPIVHPTDGLYIAFTSGSTGNPKGATMTHQNTRSAIYHGLQALGFTSTTRVLGFSSYAFDAVWLEFLYAMASGGCLCIPSDLQRNSGDLAGCIAQLQVNHALLTPSTARLLDAAAVPTLRTLVLIGEAVTGEDLARWAGKVDLKNGYGPAECSALTTIYTFEGPNDQPSIIGPTVGLVPWVVEPSDGACLSPLGAVGELWVEGPLVGKGYLGDPDKTAASFVYDPSWLLHGAPGYPGRQARLYKTGDLVRYTSDGRLIYVGRKDTQVKIRGQRVELAEIEHYIKQATRASVVVDMASPQGS
ncbi:amino acid adenylation, partial [Aspergillus violaceofuscus CBS 115571]